MLSFRQCSLRKKIRSSIFSKNISITTYIFIVQFDSSVGSDSGFDSGLVRLVGLLLSSVLCPLVLTLVLTLGWPKSPDVVDVAIDSCLREGIACFLSV